ncbi:D-alanyl-D-alanine carboxypeptidase [Niveispirillum lacus]|uniref:D-alanyl-D-alanine carboxypeptidase n=1 Tax=Niveispirillum lacus TaxID=1981099 RepID=A0A255Z520_9PROT|nr:D-alanyl-D-alanine carboxypeptidase [Niveispirillum lacus]OYQ36549.1 D-alanyl-D-alanine carboxypeptidase [Niveispirillum lacus]
MAFTTIWRRSTAQSRMLVTAVAMAVLVAVATPATAFAKYASIVIDAKTGEVLHEASADTRNFPASMTKMMTLHLVFDALNAGKIRLNQTLPVSRHASNMEPSKLGLRPGDSITTEQCIQALVTKSANDCAVVLAEALGGTEQNFARMMTDRARQLGMSRTTFRNASGLPNAGQLSTARDFARLSQSLIYDHAKYYHYFAISSFTYKGVVHRSHNRLMARYEGMDGMKTGYIRASGFNLASSAVRDGRRLIGIVFGGQTGTWRDNHMADLLDDAFNGRREAPMLVASNQSKPAKTKPRAKQTAPETMVAAVSDSIIGTANAAPAVASVPASRAGGKWAIQVGAFNDKAQSQRAVNQATQKAGTLLDSATPHLMEVSTAKGTLYRARLTGLDEKTARRACAHLSKSGQNCLTLPPAGL